MDTLSGTTGTADPPLRSPGRIITFYSYKGGTGRSMALANVAWILAMNGKRVLVIDWDFEAPGLHRYFAPFLFDPEMTETLGLIDFFVHFGEAARLQSRKPSITNDPNLPWFAERTDLTGYSTPLDYEFPLEGGLDFVGAGQQGSTYGVRVNTFQWNDFYQQLGGGVFLEAVKERLRDDYDFILIDSRTGLSDTSGICTVQMPDELVVCFTLNRQSIYGATATAASADVQRRRADGTQGLKIWPVPTRVELHEKDRLEAARLIAREKFAPFLWHIPVAERPVYWGSIEVLYFPYYAYDEVLATIADAPHDTASLLASMLRLTERITGGKIRSLPPLDRETRAQLLARYQPATPTPTTSRTRSPRVYLSYARADGSLPFVRRLAAEITAQFGEPSVFWDEKVPLGVSWEGTLNRELAESDVLVVAAGPKWKESTGSKQELRMALENGKPVVPLLIKGASWKDLPPELSSRRGVEFPQVHGDEEIRALVGQLTEGFARNVVNSSAAPVEIDDPQKGQWGGLSETGGRRLSAMVVDQGNGWFLVGLTVAHVDGPPLSGEVEFHLHPSFHPSIIRVQVRDGHATLKCPAWGAFTVGAATDEGSTRLELDLAELAEAPEPFRSR
jgi:hypothetical protein